MRSALFRKALADVRRRPARSVLAILGILCGVFGLTTINIAQDGVAEALQYSANHTQSSNIRVAADDFDQAKVQSALAAIPGITTIQFLQRESVRWQVPAAPGHQTMFILSYADPAHVAVDPFQVTSGRLPGAGEIALDETDSALGPAALGGTVTVQVQSGTQTLRIVGLTRTLGTLSAGLEGSATGLVSANEAHALFGTSAPDFVSIRATGSAPIQTTVKQVRQVFVDEHIQTEGIGYDIGSSFSEGPLPGIFAIMRVLAIIALVLSAFLIINTITTLVTEQMPIIGTMKAIGGTRGAIMWSYLLAVLIYGVAGTVLGLAAGILGGMALTKFIASIITLDLGPFQISAGEILLAIAIGLGVPILAALGPLWSGTGITAKAAMSGYGLVSGTVRRERITPRRVPQILLVGARGLFRRPGRAALTLVTLVLSATVFLAIRTTTESVNATISTVFSTVNFDVQVDTNLTDYATLRQTLLALPNVNKVEALGYDEIQTRWGLLDIQAFQPNTQIYRYDLIKGQWLTSATTNDLVISDIMSQRTGLRVGDSVTLSAIATTQTYHIIGEVHDLNDTSGTIGTSFMTLAALNTFNGYPNRTTTDLVAVQAVDRSVSAVDILATAIDQRLSAQGLNPGEETRQQFLDRNQSQFAVLYALLYAVAGIVGLVGLLGLANTLTTSVLERRREIGILRSMGASSTQVGLVFWTEGLSLGMLAWLAGVIIGIPAALAFIAFISNQLLAIQFTFNPLDDLLMLAVVLVIVMLACLGPALGASRARIAEIVRYE